MSIRRKVVSFPYRLPPRTEQVCLGAHKRYGGMDLSRISQNRGPGLPAVLPREAELAFTA